MSGGFIMNQLRDELSRRCVVVRGFLPYTVPQQVVGLFRCLRTQPASDGTWLVLFKNQQDAKEWVTKYSTYSVGNMNLHLTASTPRDIPDAWLQDDQGGSAGVQMPGYPSPGLPGYPGQGYPGIMSPPPQKEQMHANPYTQNVPGPGQPFQYPSPDCRKTGGVPSASGPQVVTSDPVSHKASMDPTIYKNFPSMPQTGNYPSMPHPGNFPSMPQTGNFPNMPQTGNFPSMPQTGNFPSMPQPGAPPSYESHNFKPKVPPRHSISKSSEAMQSEPSTMKQPDVMESINRSSDAIVHSAEQCTSVPAEESRPPDCDSIRVSCLPRGVSEEFISDFFENVKRSGGGDVSDVKYDEQSNTAIVTFEDLNVVKSVLKKHETSSLQMNKQQIEIEEYHPKADDESLDRLEETEECTAIKVTNLPPRVSEEQLELFFENHRKSGGGEVERVEYDVDTNSAVVWFKDANDVTSVLQKQESAPLMINKQTVEVEEYRPHQGDNLNSSVEEESGGALKVTKLPRGTTEEQILLFFENRKKSGGGEVEKVDYDEASGSAVVWFTDADVVSSVLQKVPLLFNKKQIHVEEVRMDGEKMEKEAEEEVEDAATGSRCTIEVRGMADKTSTDSVELYFDNKRKSGGGDVEEVKGEVEDGVLYITFENEETVERVLKREHKIDGSILNVKLYQPPKPKPMYPDRVLIKGFKPETTKDGLINYLEAKSGEDIKDVVYGQEEGTAIVIFDELKDFSKLEAACLKKPLEKKYLTVKKVPISNCILVSGFTAGTSVDTLEFYFDNEKRSGGGGVQDIKVSEEDDTCLVYFENHAVCDKVCQRSHKVDNQKLTVHVYHECLGQPCNPEIGRKFKPLPPLVVRELELRKMKFVYTSDEIKEALNKQAELTHGKIKWPKRANTELTVECTLTKDVKDCQKLAKTWEKNMADGIHRMLETLQVEAVSVLQEMWQKVLEGIKQLNVPNPQKVGIVIEKDKSTIVIVGFRNMIDGVKRDIEQITAMVAEEIQKKKQQVTEHVPLKHHQFLLLSFDHFKEATEKKFPDMKITTNMKEKNMTFEGQYSEVCQAKISLFERCQQICSISAGKFSKNRQNFLSRKDVKSRISKILKEKENMSCFDFQRDEVMLHAFSDSAAVEAAHLIKDSIVESPIDVQPDSAYLLNSESWSSHVRTTESDPNFEGLLQIISLSDERKVIIITFNEYVGLARELVEDFLRNNTIMRDSMDIPPSYCKFLELHHKGKFEEISERLKEQQVQITKSKTMITIKGTQEGLNQARRNIDDMLKKIHTKKHTLKKPGIAKHLKTSNGQAKIAKVEKFHKCYIQIGEESQANLSSSWSTKSGPAQRQDSSGVVAEHKTKSGVSIKVHSGDLTVLPVDVIVNAANPDLIHQGGLAGVLVKKGGNEIQRDCTDHVRQNGKLTEGETYCSVSGKLSCKMIVHACGPTWKGGMNQESDRLTDCIEAALSETQNKGYRSVVIPALCTGIFGYPIKQATSVIVKAVKSCLKDDKYPSIREVVFCDVRAETVRGFTEALKQEYRGKVTVINKNVGGGGNTQSVETEKKGPPPQNTEFKAGQISVKLIKGQIAKSKADVIVNTASKDLNLSQGAVSATISKTGGDSIQQECRSKYPDGINPGEIAVTSGGNLACKVVCHGALPAWDKKGQSKQVLQTFIKACLTEAQSQNMASIAFPAMGTGNLGYPKDVVAEEMCSCIVNFSKDNPKTSVKKVSFVIYEKDVPTIQAFETEMSKRASKNKNPKPKKQGKRHGDLGKEEDGFVVIPEELAAKAGKQKEVSVDIGPIKLRMYQGDITRANVDVIINGTDSDMDLSRGGVSKVIKSKLGGELQRQIEIQKPNMKKHGLAVTVNGEKSDIPSKFIIHVDLTGGNYKRKIMDVLHKVEEMKMKTVALPALGTGQGYHQQSIDEFAQEVYGALNKMYSDIKSLSEVHVVIYEYPMAQKFIIAMQKCFESQGAKPKGFIESIKNFVSGGKSVESKDGDGGWKPVVADKPDDQSSVTIVVYANNQRDIDAGITKLENLVGEDFNTKEFEDPIIGHLSPAQMKALQNLRERFDIDVNIDKGKGIVSLHGTKEALLEATDHVHNLLRDADRNKQAKLEADLVSDIVQWYFVDSSDGKNELMDYPKNINLLIEKAYRNKQPDVKFTDQAGTEYTINFNNMEEFPSDDTSDLTTVTRRDKIKDSTFEPPPEWSAMTDNLAVVQVPSGNPEYSGVIDRFQGQVGKKNIVKLERIQNKMLYQQYVAKKKLLESQNPPSTQNERELWHGTAPEAVNSINSLGFNRSYCGKNAVAYGEGVYFAVNAGYSASNTYSRPDPSGHKRMYLCKVLTGEYIKGQGGMRVPPTKPGQQTHILYDSVVNDVNNPIMFIIFNDTQGYPAYLITFT